TPNTSSPDLIRSMTTEMILDFVAIHLNGPKVGDKSYAFNLEFPDIQEKFLLTVKNGVMNYAKDKTLDKVDGSVTLNRSVLDDIALSKLKMGNLTESGEVTVDGDKAKFKEMLSNLDTFNFWFKISEP